MVYTHLIERKYWSWDDFGICSILDFTLLHGKNYTKHNMFPLLLHNCNKVGTVGYVCERPVESKQQTQPRLPAGDQDKLFQPDLYLACPSGHVTHKFLSCDLQSTCWARLASSIIICESPSLPLPPMYECANQFERVPYNLVCDHRPDCRDYSDENFCAFSECSGASFQCGNKQVIMILCTAYVRIPSVSNVYYVQRM